MLEYGEVGTFICSQALPSADHAREEGGIVVEAACRVQPRPNAAQLLPDVIVVSGEADEPERVSMLGFASFSRAWCVSTRLTAVADFAHVGLLTLPSIVSLSRAHCQTPVAKIRVQK